MGKSDIRKELKSLGIELSSALKQIRSSREFRELEHEIATGIKNISVSLVKSLKAAGKSRQTKKIGSHLKRLAEASASEGRVEAAKAQRAALAGLRRVRVAVKDLSSRVRRNGAS
ncbi:MAG: hypothetical protein JO102_01925 [Elusimicrobia bacterium]|nr:hypothetical protein [Elusimicrobiota bacterium]